jgi:hypothetical protein
MSRILYLTILALALVVAAFAGFVTRAVQLVTGGGAGRHVQVAAALES